MTDDYDWFDKDENPQVERTEPHCFTCNDDGFLDGFRRAWWGDRYQVRSCPDCHPTRVDVLRHRVQAWAWRTWMRLNGRTGEAPF